MNLLLLLSALLSALTGVGASARASEPARTVAEATIVCAAATLVPERAESRPVRALPAPVAVADDGPAMPTRARVARLWIDRRRE